MAIARVGSVTIPPKHRVIGSRPAVYESYRFLCLACGSVACIERDYHRHTLNTISFLQKKKWIKNINNTQSKLFFNQEVQNALKYKSTKCTTNTHCRKLLFLVMHVTRNNRLDEYPEYRTCVIDKLPLSMQIYRCALIKCWINNREVDNIVI